MSNKGPKNRFAPGGREYERKKAARKRQAPKRGPEDAWEVPEDKEGSDSEENSGSGSSSEESSEDEKTVPKQQGSRGLPPNSDDEDEDEDDEDWKSNRNKPGKAKGLEGIIDVENPNRVAKTHMKVTDLKNITISESSQNRKQRYITFSCNFAAVPKYCFIFIINIYIREEEERKKIAQNSRERQDLERLAQIRKQREEAAKKREEEQKGTPFDLLICISEIYLSCF